MSWFSSRDPFPALGAFDTVGEEVAEGVTLARRGVLWLGAASVGTLLGLGTKQARAAQEPGSEPPKDEFLNLLRELYPLALEQRDGAGRHEESYLMQVAAALARLAEPGTGVGEAMRKFRAEHPEHDRSAGRFPIAVVDFDLQAGKGFAHHDHRDYNGVILGLSGEARVRNYDIVGDEPVPPRGRSFEIRETRDDLLLPGRFSTLGRRRENVHELVAGPEGARVLDFFTYYAADARSYYLEVGAKPRDPQRRIYEAAWK